ncbi:MAG: nuclear transport factor 2 family protein [Oligoflexales bacterium]
MSKTEILQLEKKLTEADASMERDTRHILEELLAPNAKIVGPKGELYDKDFILNAHGPQRIPFKKVHVKEMDIASYPDTAMVHSLNTYETQADSFTLRFFRVWKKESGKWKIVGGSTTIVP